MFGSIPHHPPRPRLIASTVSSSMTGTFMSPSTVSTPLSTISRLGMSATHLTRISEETSHLSLASSASPSHVLFGHPLYVMVREGEDEKRQQLLVTISTITSSHQKTVNLVITKPLDHFFYYSMTLLEEDFTNLRIQQGLLVDFGNFPSMVVQLLEKCMMEGQTNQPRFVLVLNCSQPQASLDFTELNLFKHLVHLSLVVLRATDSQLKDYLVTRITFLTKEKEDTTVELQKMVDTLQQQLVSKTEQLQDKTEELQRLEADHSEQSSSLGQRLDNEVEEHKRSSELKLQQMQTKIETDKIEMETKHGRTIQQLENRVASLDVQNRDLVEIRYRNEASLREVKGHLVSREDELTRVKMELANVRKEKLMMESSGGDRDRRADYVSSRLAVAEQELRDKIEMVRQQQELVRQVEMTRDRLARDVEEKNKLVEKREKAVKCVSEEILKANEIIRKLQEGMKQQQGKVKLRGQIATEQERLLGDKDRELGECREQIKVGKEDGIRLSKVIEELKMKMLGKDNKVEDLEKVLKTNENVINWLNKQITTANSSEPPGLPGTVLPRTEKEVGAAAFKRGGRGVIRGRGASVGAVKQISANTVPGLDPKYFTTSTPGGTNWRQEIPDKLPANVRRGAGLCRKHVD